MIRRLVPALALAVAFGLPSAQAAPEQVLRWHGALQADGEPATGAHDFAVRLYAQPTGGTPLGPTITLPALPLDGQGRFTLDLLRDQLPLPTAGGWMEVSVRRSDVPGSLVVLSPRRHLAGTPYAHNAETAQFAASVPNASIGSAQINANQVQVRISSTCPANTAMYQVAAGGVPQCRGYGLITGVSASAGPGLITTPNFNGVAGRWLVSLTAGAIGGQHLASESVTAAKFKAGAVTTAKLANFAVGTEAVDKETVQLRIWNGCETSGAIRRVRDDGFATCGIDNLDGINGNQIDQGSFSSLTGFIGSGGVDNRAELWSFIGGGRDNTATNPALVGGGYNNSAEWNGSVLGGRDNTVRRSVIAGGSANCAPALHSFAAGYRAKIRKPNGSPLCSGVPTFGASGDYYTFIWADSQEADFVSDGSEQFLVRAAGGIHFGTHSTVSLTSTRFIGTSTGAYLTTGGTWTNASSRAWKTPFLPIDTRAILRGVMALPMSTWEYIASPGEGRHLGPMAEDFAAAFGVGEATTISTTDSAGVALAALQGLAAQSAEGFEALRARLAAENAALADEIAELAGMVAALETGER